MIFVKLYAGMGNQMFQYAFARFLQTRYKQDIVFDISSGTDFCGKDLVDKGDFILDGFSLKRDGISLCKSKDEFIKASGWRMKLACACDSLPRGIRKITQSNVIYEKIEVISQRILNPLGFYTAFDIYCEPHIIPLKRNIYVSGLFTNKKYFEEIREDIIKEFVPICEVDAKNDYFLKMICEEDEESVCVHIRKGADYVANRLAVCSIEYYKKAIGVIEDRIQGCKVRYFVFSNDIEWCKKELNNFRDFVYVDANDGAHPVEELRLMMSCNHFILSNSTMSWWAQYLCKNRNPIVISPSKWYSGKIAQLKGLIEENWIKIEV